jgi:N-acetylmuramoyl-L-alanine amidase
MFISAGHSNTDPGAVGNGHKEADIAVEIRNIVSFYLTRAGIKHELDSNGTANLPLAATVKRSVKHSVSVEFHCNASDKPSATGCEVLCGRKDNALAQKICDAIANTLGIRNRGVKAENSGHHSKLAFIGAGGVIVELFFISNADDVARYQASKWLLGKAIADVLAKAV